MDMYADEPSDVELLHEYMPKILLILFLVVSVVILLGVFVSLKTSA